MASHIISKSSSGVAHKRPLNSDGAFQRRCGSDSSTSEAAMTYVSKVSNEGEDSTTTTKASSPPPKKIKVSIGLTAPPTMVLQTPPPRKIPRSVVTPTDNLVLTGLELQKISPSVAGIQEVSRHLRRRSPSPRPNSKTHTLLALPTECSYEICALIDWKKDEESSSSPTSEEFDHFRTERLTQVKMASSAPLHVYLPHNDIGKVDKVLNFPKKAFALKQNPTCFSSFNESRVVFQRLADQFWPGPVLIYIKPQSSASAPYPLMHGAQNYVGFRCPSHPLTVKVIRQINREVYKDTCGRNNDDDAPKVLVGSPVSHLNQDNFFLCKGEHVIKNFAHMRHKDVEEQPGKSSIQVLHGEETKEIFSVPTCQFRGRWLECWIETETRTVIIRGNSGRKIDLVEHHLRNAPSKSRILQSVMLQWKVVDQRNL